MVALGFTLLMVGAALVVAEAHVPTGAFGVAGGLVLMAGGIIAIVSLGGGLLVAAPVGIALAAAAGGWSYLAIHSAGSARRARVRGGREGLCGRVGVVRKWSEGGGQVFVDGTLWRARDDWPEDDDGIRVGDAIVVQGVSGLTLAVRRAEEWELLR
jgi:membrane-bound serine protease (ClpP class)